MESFSAFFALAQVFASIFIVLLTIWLNEYRGGFAWQSTPGLEFNWHPLLMTLGMIFLNANAIMTYRALRQTRKKKLKLTHAGIQLGSFVFTVVGLVAVFDSHNLSIPPTPNMYSLHSWIGLIAVIIFAGQWVLGFVTFLYPMLNSSIRASVLPIHVFFGLTSFGLSIVAAMMGITEKLIWVKAYNSDTLSQTNEWVVANVTGIFILLFGVVVFYIITESRYKRQPLPEEEIMLNSPTSQ